MSKTAIYSIADPQRLGSPAAPLLPGAALFCDVTWAALAASLRLSGRELEIVRGIFNDQKEHAIASELGVSRHTVHTERQRLYRKLGVRDRPQLILRVVAEFRGLP